MSKKNRMDLNIHPINHLLPLLPKPPSPRAVSFNSSTSSKVRLYFGSNANCAILSCGSIFKRIEDAGGLLALQTTSPEGLRPSGLPFSPAGGRKSFGSSRKAG